MCLGLQGSIVVVVTPLISLMIDQKEKFSHRGITVDFVGAAQEDEKVIEAVLNGDVQLVYISPESLLNNYHFYHMLQTKKYQENMKCLVIDEAHCVKLW